MCNVYKFNQSFLKEESKPNREFSGYGYIVSSDNVKDPKKI